MSKKRSEQMTRKQLTKILDSLPKEMYPGDAGIILASILLKYGMVEFTPHIISYTLHILEENGATINSETGEIAINRSSMH